MDTFLTGDVIEDRYRVDEIRKGGMGIVYLTTDLQHDKPVAIKTFDDRFFQSEANRRQFYEEALMWIELGNHPNIVRAYSLQYIHEKLHLLLERVIPSNPRGATIKDYIYSTVLSVKDMLQFAIHICNGMIHANSRFTNFVHRDLKSENILIGKDKIPKISDFGMTIRWEQIEEPSTVQSKYKWEEKIRVGELATRMEGTPAFASPEQCMCKVLDTRSDIYSFGCILYNIVTKRLPFYGETVEEQIISQLREYPTPPDRLNTTIPSTFSAIILTCLNKKPEDRYSNFEILRDELSSLFEYQFSESPVAFTKELPFQVDEYVDRALTFFLFHRTSKALEELNAAAALEPLRQEIWLYQGRIYYAQENYSKALESFNKAKLYPPLSADLLEWLGKTYNMRKQIHECLDCWHEALRIDPSRITVYRELTHLYIQLKNFKKAVQILQDGLETKTNPAVLNGLLADVYNCVGDTKKERAALIAVLQVEPDDVPSLLRLARIHMQLREKREAMRRVKQAEYLQPQGFEAWRQIGNIYLENQELITGAEAWGIAAMTGEGDHHFYAELADLYYRLRRYEDAWNHTLRAEELGGDVELLKRNIQAKRFTLDRW